MLLGMVGKARSGKDTFSEFLVECFKERYDRHFESVAFAGVLKDMCMSQFDLSWEQLYGNRKEVSDVRYLKKGNVYSDNSADYWTPREIMQELGSFYRKIDYDYWVRALDKNLKDLDLKDVIITDVRHINEAEYVKNNGGVLIQVRRKELQEIHGMDHESETALDGVPKGYFHIEVDNDGALEDLFRIAGETTDAIISMENIIKKENNDGKE